MDHPRTGGKGLRATQVYPKGFGKRVCELHEGIMVHLAELYQKQVRTIVGDLDDCLFVLIMVHTFHSRNNGQAAKGFKLQAKIKLAVANLKLKGKCSKATVQ